MLLSRFCVIILITFAVHRSYAEVPQCPGGRIELRKTGKFCCYDKEISECYKIITSPNIIGDDELGDEELGDEELGDEELADELADEDRMFGTAGGFNSFGGRRFVGGWGGGRWFGGRRFGGERFGGTRFGRMGGRFWGGRRRWGRF